MMAASVVGKGIAGKRIKSSPAVSPSPHSTSLHEPLIAKSSKLDLYFTISASKSIVSPSNDVKCDEDSSEGVLDANDQLSSLSPAGKQLALSSPLGLEASPVPSIVNEEETNIALSQLKELDLAISARKVTKIDGRKTRWIEYRKKKQDNKPFNLDVKKARWLDFSKDNSADSSANARIKKELISSKLLKFKAKKKSVGKIVINLDSDVDINENSPAKNSYIGNELLMEDLSNEAAAKSEPQEEEELTVTNNNNNNNNNINNNNKINSSIKSEPVASGSTMKVEAAGDIANISGTTNVLETMKQHFLQGTVNVPDTINNGVKEKSVTSKKHQNLVNGSQVVGNEVLKRKRGRPKKDKASNGTIEIKDVSTNIEIKQESTNDSTNTIENKSSISTSPNGNLSLTPIVNGSNSEQNIKFDFPGYSQSTTDFYARKNYLTKGLREVRKSESGSESGASSPEKNCSTPLPVSPISHSPPNWAGDVNIAVPKCPLISAAAKMLSAGNKKLGTTYGLAAKKKKILKKLSKKENIHKKENINTDSKPNGNSNNLKTGVYDKNILFKGLIKSLNNSKDNSVQIKRGRGRPKTKVDLPGLKWTKKISTVIADVHNTMSGEPQTVITANNSLIQRKKKLSQLKKTFENELGQVGCAIEDEIVSCVKDKSESPKINNSGNFNNESIVPDLQLASSSTSTSHTIPKTTEDFTISQGASKFNQSLLNSTNLKNENSSLDNEEKFVQNINTLNSSVGEKQAISNQLKDRAKTLTNSTMPSSKISINSENKPDVPDKITDNGRGRVLISKKSASTIIVSTAEALKQQNPADKKRFNDSGNSRIGLQNISNNGSQGLYTTSTDSKQVTFSAEITSENKVADKSTKPALLVQDIPLSKNGDVKKIASPLNNSSANSSSNKSVTSTDSDIKIIHEEKHIPTNTTINTNTTKSISDRLPTSTVVTLSNKLKAVKKPLQQGVSSNKTTPIGVSSSSPLISPKLLVNKSLKKPQEKLKNKSLDAVIEKLHSPNSKRNDATKSIPSAQFSNNSSSLSVINNVNKSFEKKDSQCSISAPKNVNELQTTNLQNSAGNISANEKKTNLLNNSSNERRVIKQNVSDNVLAKSPEKKTVKQHVSNLTVERKIVNQEVVQKNVKLNRTNSISCNFQSDKKVDSQSNVPITESSNISGEEKKATTVCKLKLVANDKQTQLKSYSSPSVNKEDGHKDCLNSSVTNGEKDRANDSRVTNQSKVSNGNTEKLGENEASGSVKPDEKIPRYLKQLFQDEGVQNMLRSVNEEATSSIDGSPSIDGSSHKLRPKRVNENFNSDAQEMDEAYYLSNSKRKRRGTELDNLYSDEGALSMLTSIDNERKKVQMNDDAASDMSQESNLKNAKLRKIVHDVSASEFTRKRRLSGSATGTIVSTAYEPKKQKLEDKDSGIDISPSSTNSENQRISPVSQTALLEKRKPGRPSLPVALKKKTILQLQFQLKKQLQRIGITSENLSIPQMKEILNKVRVKETYTTNKPLTSVPPLKIKLPAQIVEKQVRSNSATEESSAITIKQTHMEKEGVQKPPNRIFKTLVASHQGSGDGNRATHPTVQITDKVSPQNTTVKRIANSCNQVPLQSLLRPLDPSLGQKNKVRSVQEGIRHSQRASVRQAEGGHYRDITLRRFNNFMHVILTPSTTKMKNALNSRVLRELCDALTMLKRDDSVRMVLFTSTGSTFCQGIDLTSLQHPNQDTRKKNAENLARGIKDFLRALSQFPKMIVAGVNGNAMGLGVTILPLFDLVFASDKAEFFLPYSRLGQVPEGGATYTFPYYYGKLQANKMFFGQKVTATQAQQVGLISEAIWHETFLQDLIPKVALLATQSPQSMEGTKALVNHHIVTKLELSVESECRLLIQHWMTNQFTGLSKKFLETADIQLQKPVNLPL